MASAFEGLSRVFADQGDIDRALRLAGSAAGLRRMARSLARSRIRSSSASAIWRWRNAIPPGRSAAGTRVGCCRSSGRSASPCRRRRDLRLIVCRIDEAPHRFDAVDWKTGDPPVLGDECFVGREVDAINLVVGDEAVDPLDLWPELAKRLQRTEGGVSNLRLGHLDADGTLRSMMNFGMTAAPFIRI